MSSLPDLHALTQSMLVISPLICILVGGVALMMIDAFSKDDQHLPLLSAVVLLMAAVLAGTLLSRDPIPELPVTISKYLRFDRAGYFFDIVICIGAAFATLMAGGYLKEHRLERGEFYPLMLFTTLGALALARSVDLLSFFLGLETMSLGVYALVAYRRTSARALEGGLKYFLLGSFATAILLFGMALLYGATGKTNFAEITDVIAKQKTGDVRLILGAMLLLVTALAFKVSAAPFHMWTPDAYEGAATPVTAFMAIAVKTAVVAVMLRVLTGVFADPESASMAAGWPPVLAALAVASMIYGNFAALGQKSIKRMLAYSSIAHAGYMLVGIIAAHKANPSATSAVLFYLMSYALSNALAFGSLIILGSRGREAVHYDDLAGAGRRHPLVALPFVIGVLSLMGFPPTAGFFGKYYVFSAAVEAGGMLIPLAVVAMLTSAIGAYYYLKVIVYLFMREPEPNQTIAIPMQSSYVTFTLVLSGLWVMQMGIAPSRYVNLVLSIAEHFISS